MSVLPKPKEFDTLFFNQSIVSAREQQASIYAAVPLFFVQKMCSFLNRYWVQFL
jgi:hypothetical protein